jgi:hypothetical protein
LTRLHLGGARLAAPLLFVAAGACAPTAPATAPAPAAAPHAIAPGATEAAITPADMRHRLEIIAHDSMEGRDTGSRGLRLTADYIAGEMARLGLRPAGDGGTWFHRVDLERTTYHYAASARTPGGELDLRATHAVPVSGQAGLPANPRPTGEGAIVYAGYQVDPAAPALTREQFDGAAVIVRLGPAPGATGGQPRWMLPMLIGPGSPASAVLVVAEGDLEQFWSFASRNAADGSIGTARPVGPGGGGPAIFLVTPEGAERLIGRSLDGARETMTGLGTFRYELREAREPIEAFNVVAALPGSDPRLAGQYMTLGAHYDHDGIGSPVDGDSIYNGADDNGSGTVALMEIAERFAHASASERPARSVLFVWHTAEEKGLLGSEQFTDRPTVPRDSMVAHINLDMVGRNHPDTLMVVGSRRISTEYGALVEAVNARKAQPFVFDYSYDAPGHPEMIYCRSDHANFARYGIPIVFFTTGLHDDYHKPSDTVEKVDFAKLARVATLAAEVTLEVANRPERLVRDQPVPPLGTPCS